MPSVSGPYGMMPTRRYNGGDPGDMYVLQGGIASGYAATIGIGDAIRGVTAGSFQKVAAGETIDAVFGGVEYTDAQNRRHVSPIWTTGTVATNIVVKGWLTTGLVFKIQSSATLAATAVFDAADIIVGAPNARSGQSTTQLGTLVGAGNSAQLKIVNLIETPNNAWGDTYVDVEVMVNEPGLGFTAGNAL